MRWMVSWIACAALVTVPAAFTTAAAGSGTAPKLSVRMLEEWIPGEPLGPWAEAARRPMVLLVWPPGKPAPASGKLARRIADRYKDAGLGIRFLCINGPELPLPSARIPKRHARRLVTLAGPEAERAMKTASGAPAALIRHPDGRLEWRGSLDLEHGGYNLIIGIKQALVLHFDDLAPLKRMNLADRDGKPVELERFLDGLDRKLVFLDIWGSWCPDCRRSLPHLVRLAKRFGPRVGFVGIACEDGDTRREQWDAVEAYLNGSGLDVPYPILLGDLWGLRLSVPEFRGYPTLLLLRKETGDDVWRVLWQQVGFEAGDERKIEKALWETLAETAQP